MTTSPGKSVGDEALLDIVGKAMAVDRLIEHARGVDPVAAECRKEGHRAPVAIGHLGMEPLPLGSPSPQWSHVGFGPGFVDEDEALGIKTILILLPLCPAPPDPRAKLFGGQYAFFEAQTLSVNKPPDLHIINLHPALGQLGDKPTQGEVAIGTLDQPVAVP